MGALLTLRWGTGHVALPQKSYDKYCSVYPSQCFMCIIFFCSMSSLYCSTLVKIYLFGSFHTFNCCKNVLINCLFVFFSLYLFEAIWHQRWQSVEGSWCLKSPSCSVWGGMSPPRHLRSTAWRRACNRQRACSTARVTSVWHVVVANILFIFCTAETLRSVFSFTLLSLMYFFSSTVADLDEKLHRCEADRLNCVQRVKVLEEQLQAVRGELADTLQQLQKLRDVLQRTQTISDERQASMEKLTIQLRWGYAHMWNIPLHTGTRDTPLMAKTFMCCYSDKSLRPICVICFFVFIFKQYGYYVSQTQNTQSWTPVMFQCPAYSLTLSKDNVMDNLYFQHDKIMTFV